MNYLVSEALVRPRLFYFTDSRLSLIRLAWHGSFREARCGSHEILLLVRLAVSWTLRIMLLL